MASSLFPLSNGHVTRLRSLVDCDCIGFDMDHTLVRYHIRNLEELILDCIVRYLHRDCKYPEEVLQIRLDYDYCKKGLILDKKGGNIIKLDAQGRVVRGYHGKRLLTEKELNYHYGDDRKTNFNGSNYGRWWSLTTYFDTPSASIFSALVEMDDLRAAQNDSMSIYYRDYSSHLDAIHNGMYHSFVSYNRGDFFPAIHRNPEKYLRKQPGLRRWLESMRDQHHRFLFILTNSGPEFADLLMTYTLGEDWTTLFDLVCTLAQKPSWFTDHEPYYPYSHPASDDSQTPLPPLHLRPYPGPPYPIEERPLDSIAVTNQRGTCKHRHYYLGGNAPILVNALRAAIEAKAESHRQVDAASMPSYSGKHTLEVAYFGDHIRNDVAVAKSRLNWHTVAIVEELEDAEAEFGYQLLQPPVEWISGATELPDSEFRTNTDHFSANPYWGSFFLANNNMSAPELVSVAHMSYWAHEAFKYADIAVPSMERLAQYPPDAPFMPGAEPRLLPSISMEECVKATAASLIRSRVGAVNM